MKKLLKLNLFFCFFALAIACVFPLAIPKGSVFAAEPVLPAEPIVVTISDAASLNAFRDSVNDGTFVVGSTAVLTADIAFMAPGENFVPIGTKEHPFVGTFDGGGNCISGLNFLCEDSSVMNAGFFGVVKHGEIKNLGIKNISIKLTNVFAKSESRLNVGGLCGHAIKTRITNCFVENTNNMTAIDISSKINTFVGGIVGLLEDSTIYNAFSSAKISAYATSDAKDATFNAGGLAGMIAGSEILNCYSLSDLELKNLNDSYVNLTNNIGGIVGFVNDFNVMLKNNFFVGDITTFSRNNATYNMGTIVGAFHSNSIFVPESGKINYCNFSKDGNKNVGIDWVGKISTYSDAGLFFKQCSNEFFKTNISFSDREKWDENMFFDFNLNWLIDSGFPVLQQFAFYVIKVEIPADAVFGLEIVGGDIVSVDDAGNQQIVPNAKKFKAGKEVVINASIPEDKSKFYSVKEWLKNQERMDSQPENKNQFKFVCSYLTSGKYSISLDVKKFNVAIEVENTQREFGKFKFNGSGKLDAVSQQTPYASIINLVAMPEFEYAFGGWFCNDKLISENEKLSITVGKVSDGFNNETFSIKLVAKFSRNVSYLNVFMPVGESSMGGIQFDGDDTIQYAPVLNKKMVLGRTVSITAKPKEGFEFVGWFSTAEGGSPISTSLHLSNFKLENNTQDIYARFKVSGASDSGPKTNVWLIVGIVAGVLVLIGIIVIVIVVVKNKNSYKGNFRF